MRPDLTGTNAAHLLPFTDDGSEIDTEALRNHISDLDTNTNINGFVTTAHGAETYALSTEERRRVVEIVDDETAEDTPLIAGLVAGSTDEATTTAFDLADAGADALLVFPPYTTIDHRQDATLTYFETIADAVDQPLVAFQHPKWAGGFYDSDLLAEIAALEEVIAVKNAVWDVDHYQRDIHALQKADADITLLNGCDEHLLPTYALRAEGSILILAAVIPDQIHGLWTAVNEDIDRACELYAELEPFLSAVYQPPIADSLPRLKAALDLMGVLPNAVPRKPALPTTGEDRQRIAEALVESNIVESSPTA
jgi:4-hydroxy-tetrahydrodipicolinate synthase